MKISKKFKSLVFVGVLLLSLPVSALAKGPEKDEKRPINRVIDYVALGDSLAAGITPFGLKDAGYPDYLVEHYEQLHYKIDYDNYAVPGYTSKQLGNDVLTNQKVRVGIKQAEYITIDIGGNDILAALKDDPTGTTVPAAIAGTAANLQTILKTIDKLNKDANVYVMGYYNTFPYLPAEQQNALLPLLFALNNQISTVSKVNGDTFVPTFDVIAANYQAYLPNPADIHLSLAGYQIVAKQFWKAIDESMLEKKHHHHRH